MRRFLSTLAFCLLPTIALAQTVTPSCFVGLSAGGAITGQQLETGGGTVTIAADGLTGGVEGGCDLKMGQALLGIIGRYDLASIQGDNLIKLDQDAVWTAALRGGWFVQPSILLYGLVGISGSEIDMGALAKDKVHGWVMGGGLELEIAKHFALFFEYSHTVYSDWQTLGLTLHPTSDAVRAGVRFRFGALPEIK